MKIKFFLLPLLSIFFIVCNTSGMLHVPREDLEIGPPLKNQSDVEVPRSPPKRIQENQRQKCSWFKSCWHKCCSCCCCEDERPQELDRVERHPSQVNLVGNADTQSSDADRSGRGEGGATELVVRSGYNSPETSSSEAILEVNHSSVQIIPRASESQAARFSDFYIAAARGETDNVQRYLSEGVQVDSVGLNGNTALLIALYNGHEEMACVLLNKGANPNFARRDGVSPLMIAALLGEEHVLQAVKRLRETEGINYILDEGSIETTLTYALLEFHETANGLRYLVGHDKATEEIELILEIGERRQRSIGMLFLLFDPQELQGSLKKQNTDFQYCKRIFDLAIKLISLESEIRKNKCFHSFYENFTNQLSQLNFRSQNRRSLEAPEVASISPHYAIRNRIVRSMGEEIGNFGPVREKLNEVNHVLNRCHEESRSRQNLIADSVMLPENQKNLAITLINIYNLQFQRIIQSRWSEREINRVVKQLSDYAIRIISSYITRPSRKRGDFVPTMVQVLTGYDDGEAEFELGRIGEFIWTDKGFFRTGVQDEHNRRFVIDGDPACKPSQYGYRKMMPEEFKDLIRKIDRGELTERDGVYLCPRVYF